MNRVSPGNNVLTSRDAAQGRPRLLAVRHVTAVPRRLVRTARSNTLAEVDSGDTDWPVDSSVVEARDLRRGTRGWCHGGAPEYMVNIQSVFRNTLVSPMERNNDGGCFPSLANSVRGDLSIVFFLYGWGGGGGWLAWCWRL